MPYVLASPPTGVTFTSRRNSSYVPSVATPEGSTVLVTCPDRSWLKATLALPPLVFGRDTVALLATARVGAQGADLPTRATVAHQVRDRTCFTPNIKTA